MKHSNHTGMMNSGQRSSNLSGPLRATRSSYSFHRTAHQVGVMRALIDKSIIKLLWSLPLDSRLQCDQAKALTTTRRSQYSPVKALDRLACCLRRMKQQMF